MVVQAHANGTAGPWKKGLGVGPLPGGLVQIGHVSGAADLDGPAESLAGLDEGPGGGDAQKVKAELFAQLFDSASRFVRIGMHLESDCTKN